MRTLLFLLQKEFLQIFRNKAMLPVLFVVPFVQLIILVNAATYEIKNIKISIVDMDQSTTSRHLIDRFKASPFFIITDYTFSIDKAEDELKANKADLILRIPVDFEKYLVRDKKAKVHILHNAINGTVAGISSSYALSIIGRFNKDIILDWFDMKTHQNVYLQPNININYSYWYNPELNYKTFMVPAVLVLIVTIIGLFLSGMNVVREKEIGTIEQINVTPIKKYQFLIGKLLPFWIIALFELAVGLILGKLLFDTPMLGSLLLLFAVAGVYLLTVLALGLLMSTITQTQQQAMFISYFFLIIFVLMSGVFTSVESMPKLAQWLNHINPVYYFMKVIRMILLKGSGFSDIKYEFFILFGFGITMLSVAVWKYKKVE
jgi:ABC-2 type transport system permease protein